MNKVLAFSGKLGSGKDYSAMRQIEKLKDDGNSILMISFADPIKQILYDSFGFTKSNTSTPIRSNFTHNYITHHTIKNILSLLENLDTTTYITQNKQYRLQSIRTNYEIYQEEFVKNVNNCAMNIDYNNSFRKLGQLLGTELGRYVNDTIWIDTAFNKIKKAFDEKLATYAIISDCRFVNEYESLLKFGKYTGYSVKIYGVVASDETRAKRRNMSLEDLKKQDAHGSEIEIDSIHAMLPKENIIDNN
jgi:hypothetical protein